MVFHAPFLLKVGVFIKKLFFLILVTFLICFNSFPSFADEQQLFDLPDFSHLVDEGEHYTISIYNRDEDISQWVVYLRVLENNYIRWSTTDLRLNYKNGSYNYYCSQGDTEWTPDGFASNPYFDASVIEYSCCDLIRYDSNEVLFQRAPIKSVGAIQISLFQMRKLLKPLVCLVPCLISLLIGLVAFRKAWNWLKKLFQI